MVEFATRDPRSPGFWDERFERRFTPWDRGGVPQALVDFVRHSARPLTTLIPGCGTAYELDFLIQSGWDATAIDFSPAAVATARAAFGPVARHIVEADFFTYAPQRPLDLIYERAFLCAMPRSLWADVAARWAGLLPSGALLAGFFFYDDHPKGPPFGTSPGELDGLLTPCFERLQDAPVNDSVPVFEGKERWQLWRRR